MKPPYFWKGGLDPKSREAAPLTRALLTPLAALYGFGVSRKIARARPHHAGLRVICVGNLTVGGVGKTPVVAALRAHLTAQGRRAASLSRGYGGSARGPLRVDATCHSAAAVGDEPLMLAAAGEAWIARARAAGGDAMAADGVEIAIMDDGHQNPSLARDLSLVVIDSHAPFGNGFLLPKGPLRERVGEGLARADAVILMGDCDVPDAVIRSGRPVLRAELRACAAPPGGPIIAFAGIGRPEKFFDSLRASGADLRETVSYGDHHVYSRGELAFLHKLAAAHGARLVTTEKDHVRLSSDARGGIAAWPVEAVFEDEAALQSLLEPVLEGALR